MARTRLSSATSDAAMLLIGLHKSEGANAADEDAAAAAARDKATEIMFINSVNQMDALLSSLRERRARATHGVPDWLRELREFAESWNA